MLLSQIKRREEQENPDLRDEPCEAGGSVGKVPFFESTTCSAASHRVRRVTEFSKQKKVVTNWLDDTTSTSACGLSMFTWKCAEAS